MSMNLGQVRVIDPILSQFARGYSQSAMMVAKMLFPEVFVGASGGQVITFGKEAFLLYETERAPGGEVKRIDVSHGSAPYALRNHALDALVPDEHQRDAAEVPKIDMAQEALGAVLDAMALRHEYDAVKMATNPDNYSADHKLAFSGTDCWDSDSSKIKAVVTEAKAKIRSKTGRKPNVLVLPPNTIDRIDMHPEIRDRLKHTTQANATASMLAAYLEVDKVVEAEAVYADSAQGEFKDVLGNSAILAFSQIGGAARSARNPSFGYTYTMRGHPNVEKPYRDSSRRSWVYGTNYERAPIIAGADAGFLLSNLFGGV